MKCEQIQNLLSEYVDNMLDAQESKKVTEHLKECKECQQMLQELEEMLSMFNKVEIINPPEDFKNNVMEKIKQENISNNKKPTIFKIKRSWLTWAATAAVVVIMIGSIGISSLNDGNILKESTNQENAIESEVRLFSKADDETEFDVFSKPENETDMEVADGLQKPNLRMSTPSDTADLEVDLPSASIKEHSGIVDSGDMGIMSLNPQVDSKDINVIEMVLKSEELNSAKNKILHIFGENYQVFEAEKGLTILAWKDKIKAQADYLEELRRTAQVEKESVTIVDIKTELEKLREELAKSSDLLTDTERQNELDIVRWKINVLSNAKSDNLLFYEISLVEQD